MLKNGLKSVLLAGIFLLALGTPTSAGYLQYYTGDISIYGAKGNITDIGTISAYLYYTTSETTLVIKYETEGSWRMTECHLWLGTQPPQERGEPGHYPYNSGLINTNEFIFKIPLSELRTKFLIDWGSNVYVMPHCAVYLDANNNQQYDYGEKTETGYGGLIIKPPKGAWYGYFNFTLIQPEPEPKPKLVPYEGETRTQGYWKTHLNENEHGSWFPITLADYYIENVAAAIALFKIEPKGNMYIIFLHQFLALYCNTKNLADLEGAYYNDTVIEGEPFENFLVGAIMDSANKYNQQTDKEILEAAKNVMDAINNNYESDHKVLWVEDGKGGQGKTVSLGNPARLTVSPNPFTASVHIKMQSGPGINFRVSIYDRAGNKVNELTAFNNEVVWNGTDANGRKLSAGVYLLKTEGTQGSVACVVISR